jgi:hypothetical protein
MSTLRKEDVGSADPLVERSFASSPTLSGRLGMELLERTRLTIDYIAYAVLISDEKS